MLILILAIVVVFVGWALHLMQESVDRREFSLMLAGTLVAFSAAAMMASYFLMGNYLGYVSRVAHLPVEHLSPDSITWLIESVDDSALSLAYPERSALPSLPSQQAVPE
ncbi:MAG TPA: hypothetical protein V6C46_08620 [Coleofasciculaceae cyanobacterium]